MPRYRSVCLTIVLCLGVCCAQETGPATDQSPASKTQATQPLTPSSQAPTAQPDSPSPTPTPSVASAPADLSTSAGLNSLQGLKVASIQINSPGVEDTGSLLFILPQKVNEPLDKYKVKQSVQALYNTGRFAEIQVEAQRSSGGEIVLIFDGRENYFFGSILAEGSAARPTDSQLVNASKLNLGEQFTEEKIRAGIEGMQRTLQENGYYQATIKPFYEWDPRNQQVNVQFVVDRGKPARVGVVNVMGDPGYSAEEVRNIAKLRSGNSVSASRLTSALQRLRKRYQKQERLEAQVTMTQRVYHAETNLLDYTFEINRGPVVDVKVEGASLRRGQLKNLVPVFEESAVDDDLLNEGARNIRDYFQSRGFFDVKVTYEQKQDPGTEKRNVIFHIARNQRHKLVDLALQGNHYFRKEDLREQMVMQPSGGLLLYGLFSQSILTRDVQSIENLYRNNGFLQVKVTPDVQDNYGKRGHIRVQLTIDEGAQTLVGKLTIEGNDALPEGQVRGMITASEGQPYSDSIVISDQSAILNEYYNLGFPKVRFDYTTQPEPDNPNKVDVSYKITEGPQVFVDKVLIAGLNYTHPSVVEREIKIGTGDRMSQSQMLDSQRRLYDMGIFNEVGVAVQNPEGDANSKKINFQLSESRRYTFNYGLGLEVQTGQPAGGTTNPQGDTGVSGRVSFDVTRLNFRGRGHVITLKTRYGNLEKLGLIGYGAPRLFDSQKLTLDFTAFYQQTNDVSTFTSKRLEGSVSIKQEYNRATTLLYRLIYRRVSTSNLVIDPNLVPLFSQAVRVGMPDFSYIRDTRDNPIESLKGTFSSFDLGVASSFFGSQTNFTRVVAQNSSYYQFHKRRWVFARSTRIGVEEPFASTDFAPLPERFFAGGSTSHRGFGINQAGPRDLTSGFPLGGEALFLNNLELRTPPLPLPLVGNNLSAVLFHDMGNVFSTAGDMVNSILKFSQPDRSLCLNPAAGSCNFNYVSHAVGAGARYRTPIGPVSFDVGYNLNPPAFPISAPTPPAVPSSQVLKHFNFFFNIGQTF
ncbi:MAG TPA: POTRA domain-containing protein [Candidatus Angelobacter sp.]|nr:POTRA domain-containing protein [Candidatus Angelobacter sp.]